MSEMKFEEALKRLEEIVTQLENGNIPLEETVVIFQEGLSLAKVCKGKLHAAEKEIKKIIKNSDGEFQLTLLS